jgi:hypothetical protein
VGTLSEVTFYVLAGLVQLGFAAAILAGRGRREWRLLLAALFALNGLDAFANAGVLAYIDGVRSVLKRFLEPSIFCLLLYLALAMPDRPRLLRRPAWLVPTGCLALLGLALAAETAWPDELAMPRTAGVELTWPRLAIGFLLPAVVWTTLVVRWAVRWRRLDAPGLRAPFQFVYAAFASRAANVLLFTLPVFDRPGPAWMGQAALALNLVPLLCVLASAGWLAWVQSTEHGQARRQTLFVLGFLGFGIVEGAISDLLGASPVFFSQPLVHLDVYVLRPALVWFAITRHGLLGPQAPRPAVGLALAGTLAFAGSFLLFFNLMDWSLPQPFGLPATVAIAAVLSACLLFVVRPWLLRPPAPASAAPSWAPGTAVGPYVVDSLLGQGSLGSAYVARGPGGAARTVVLKRTQRLAGGEREALLHEARILQRLDHPNVIRLLEITWAGEEPVLVLEHAPGGSLATRMERRGRWPVAQALPVVQDVLSGLSAAHGKGIVHRDVKPSNIFLAGGRAKLGDFGVASAANAARPGAGDDPTAEMAAGSLRYMAPEQVRTGAADAQSDVYAAGIVLYRLLAGYHPVPESLADLDQRRAIAAGRLPPLPRDVPARLRAIVRQATRRAPAARYPTAAAFAEALAGFQEGRKSSRHRPTPTRSPAASGRSSPFGRGSPFQVVPLRDPGRSRT